LRERIIRIDRNHFIEESYGAKKTVYKAYWNRDAEKDFRSSPGEVRNLTDDILYFQKRLFGMHQENTTFPVPRIGINFWPKRDNPQEYFGEDLEVGDPLPPYDWMGVNHLLKTLEKKFGIELKPPDYKVRCSGPVLYVGGNRIQKYAAIIRKVYSEYLRFGFCSHEEIPSDLLPEEPPPEKITRYYVDKGGNHYEKKSDTGKYLVHTEKYREIRPFGPYVSPDGEITSDVILLTIVPGENGNPSTHVVGGYGGAVRLEDIICDLEILRSLYDGIKEKNYDEMKDEPYPWLQAVFEIPVELKKGLEYYRKPKLVGYEALGLLPWLLNDL
jgi:hypothetical protein